MQDCKIIAIVLIGMLVAGCCSNKPITVTEKVTVTETEYIRDTVVMVQPDASMIRALLECDENRNVVVKQLLEWQTGKHVQPPQIVIRENVITATAKVDSFGIYMSWKQREKQTDTEKTVPVITNELTGWQWFQVWWGRIAFVLVAIWIIYKRFKRS